MLHLLKADYLFVCILPWTSRTSTTVYLIFVLGTFGVNQYQCILEPIIQD